MLDEAHERSVNSDLLVGLLSRAVPLRNRLAAQQAAALRARLAADPTLAPPPPGAPGFPLGPLKLVIMSATLSVRDFSGSAALFPSPLWPRPPPVVSVAARQHPVSLHFARRTSDAVGYASDALAKACKVHTRLPPGGLLIFLTGQDEVEFVCAELRKRFCGGRRAAAAAAAEAASAATKAALAAAQAAKAAAAPAAGAVADADADADADAAPAAAAAATGSAPPAPAPAPALAPPSPCVVLPLYSMLSPAAQARVFAPVPEGHRLIVVATNVAETSITIPGIR